MRAIAPAMTAMLLRDPPSTCSLGSQDEMQHAYLTNEAIETYAEVSSWQLANVKEALEEDASGRSGIRHEEVVERMDSWGTDYELPMPKPKTSECTDR